MSETIQYILETLRDFTKTIREAMKDYTKVIIITEVSKQYVETENKIVPDDEKEVILLTSDLCPACNEFKKYYDILVKRLEEKGYRLTVSKLTSSEAIEECLKRGIEDIPVLVFRRGDKIETRIPHEVVFHGV